MPCSHATASDEDLSRAWQAGDMTAGSALVSRHHPAMRRYVQRRLGMDTEDTIQEVWMVVSCTIHRYQRRSSFRTWLFAIAHNHIHVAYRSQDRTRRIRALAQDLLDPPGDDPWAVCSRRQTLGRLASSLAALPGPLQEVLALYYFERESAPEIGRRLAIPENTVRSRVRRARELLADTMSGPVPGATPIASDPIALWLRSIHIAPTQQPQHRAA
ncbi:MAG: sigma-70 family RNA polymerase sigma factor [Nannocystaceae bacterium]|nr:sigma-70 family RNA polymerase sigma factor [Nannocystaceae bacterium]